MDGRLRALEREWRATGCPEARERYQRALVRSGAPLAGVQRALWGCAESDVVLLKNAKSGMTHMGAPPSMFHRSVYSPHSHVTRGPQTLCGYDVTLIKVDDNVITYHRRLAPARWVRCKRCSAKFHTYPEGVDQRYLARAYGLMAYRCRIGEHEFAQADTMFQDGTSLVALQCVYCPWTTTMAPFEYAGALIPEPLPENLSWDQED